jgi:prolyl oligopeptidase
MTEPAIHRACHRASHRAAARAAWAMALALAAAAPAMSQTPSPAPTAASSSPPAPAATAAAPAVAPEPADPHRWLEEVLDERALAWVRERNAATEATLKSEPGFADLRTRIREVLDSREQIPYVSRQGAFLYNLWRDAANPRGLWRRTTLDEYRKPQPAWETVLDLDALGRAEGENWVWAGAQCFGPAYRRCLLSLSRGGADATVLREFDTVDKRFVDGGFALPEAKTFVDWEDADTLLVGTDFGPGSMTDSGYPRVVKRWRRGTPLAQANPVFEGVAADVAASAAVDRTPGFERTVLTRTLDFYRTRSALLVRGPGGERAVPIDKPDDAQLAFVRRHVVLELRSPWTLAGRTHPAGSLLVGDARAYLAGRRNLQPLFTPTATRALAAWTATGGTLLLTISDNVASRLEEWRPGTGGSRWTRREVRAPYPGALSVAPLHDPLLPRDELAEHYLMNAADFLRPDALLLERTGSDAREPLKSRPAFFDAAGMRVEQHMATSRDGTRVPYFVVWPAGAKADGDNPTLLYGYGGFEVSLKPWYSGSMGRAWASRGGVYVVANIRGGGEFGPAWHQAALKERRQKAFDDFIAVAEDLVARKVTRPARLGIQGGSNGGLLVGAVMVQRPDLFGAVSCQVPLLDMRRYHRLLAGASWMAEYGDPDDPAQWDSISRWSPYHNVRAGVAMPAVLFTTSTRDDRVHPGHARKMAARMIEQGHRVLYWENIEGGHGGAADNAQRAQMMALEYAFLWRELARR